MVLLKLRTIYDIIDPGNYEKRAERSSREAYSHHYWKPLICKIIQKYSKEAEMALDLGCGTGVYLEEISKNSQMCVGLDLSKNMIEYAKQERKGLNLILARVMQRQAFLIISVPNKYSACRLPIKVLSKVSGKKYIKKEPSLNEMLYSFHLNNLKLIWYKMDDGLIFLPDILDRIIGEKVYRLVERISKQVLGRNPFSNVMLFLLQRS